MNASHISYTTQLYPVIVLAFANQSSNLLQLSSIQSNHCYSTLPWGSSSLTTDTSIETWEDNLLLNLSSVQLIKQLYFYSRFPSWFYSV